MARARTTRPACRFAHAFAWTLACALLLSASLVATPLLAADPKTELPRHLAEIAKTVVPSPMIAIPAGDFVMGTNRKDEFPYAMETQFDDTELPQHRVWLDAYRIDRDEASLGEFLAFLLSTKRPVSAELRKVLWHVISVHFVPDAVLARWPALYVTWKEAAEFCAFSGKRLPTEAEWEKAARGSDGQLFPWGDRDPAPGLAVFGQYHAHEIPLVAAVDSGEDGQSVYGVRHLSGNVAEWIQDWFGIDYYSVTPDRNPKGPITGRYKGLRGGSWKSKPNMLRAATRSGASATHRAPTVGFRCAADPAH